MKRNILVIMTLILALVLCACSKAPAPAGSAEPAAAETAAPTETPAAETQQPNDEDFALYEAKLQEISAFIQQGNDAEEVPEGYTGIREMMSNIPDDALSQIGYQIKDLSGDGVPELIVAAMPLEGDVDSVCNILALFTVKDGQVQQVAEGWARNGWFLLNDGSFYNSGSNGAAYAIFANYDLSEDGTELVARDYYFTYEKTEGNYEDIGFYHNTTGMYDKNVSELLDMSEDAFWGLMENYQSRIENPNLTALSALNG